MKNNKKNNFVNFNLLSIVIAVTMIILTSLGCSKNTISGLVPCEGIVTLNGQPLENASIIFAPAASNGRSAGGMTNENGYYNLRTNTSVGVLPGDYKVTVIKSIPETEKDVKLIDEMRTAAEKNNGTIPDSYNDVVITYKSLTGKYNNSQTSDLSVTITKQGNKQQNFDLKVD
ncbi:MAG: carboxypeptidase-like regulatory domain-containing protein [Planctomycetaceae bacterium]|jgi:hypothetical protein|nr:carboxypeptidase-like regulatory domain-containing protein [Planctomycetaceae bacterium]